jgi:hypothetical protein
VSAITAIGHQLRVALVVQLLGCGSAGHQAVESGNRPTGHGHEQDREDESQVGSETREGRQLDLGSSYNNPEHRSPKDHIEQEGVEVVARLQQRPDRCHRGNVDVDYQESDPETPAELQGPLNPHPDAAKQQEHSNERGRAKRKSEAIQGLTEQAGQQQEEQGGGRCRRCADKSAGHHVREHRDDQNEGGQAEDEEQRLAADTDMVLDDLAYRLTLVAQTGHQARHVMGAAHEDRAEHCPQEHRDPSKDSSRHRADDRACPRDRREMVAEQHRRLGRDIVDSIGHGVRRSSSIGIDSQPFAQECTVEDVGNQQRREGDDQQNRSSHSSLVSSFGRAVRSRSMERSDRICR